MLNLVNFSVIDWNKWSLQLQNHRQYFLFAKIWWIKAVNVENRNKYVWLSGLFCAIIRANLLTFHFIPGKFGANNRVVWLSMVWLSGLCCRYNFKNGNCENQATWKFESFQGSTIGAAFTIEVLASAFSKAALYRFYRENFKLRNMTYISNEMALSGVQWSFTPSLPTKLHTK